MSGTIIDNQGRSSGLIKAVEASSDYVKIGSGSFSSVSTGAMDHADSAVYRGYDFYIYGVVPDGDDTTLRAQMKFDGSIETGSNYFNISMAGSGQNDPGALAHWVLGLMDTQQTISTFHPWWRLHIINAHVAEMKQAVMSGAWHDDNYHFGTNRAVMLNNNATDFSGIHLLESVSQTWSASYAAYGIK